MSRRIVGIVLVTTLSLAGATMSSSFVQAQTPIPVPPAITLDPTCGPPRTSTPFSYSIKVSGSRFTTSEGDDASIYFYPQGGTRPTSTEGVAQIQGDGTFTATITPLRRPPGLYTVEAVHMIRPPNSVSPRQPSRHRSARATFTVPCPTTTTSLTTTTTRPLIPDTVPTTSTTTTTRPLIPDTVPTTSTTTTTRPLIPDIPPAGPRLEVLPPLGPPGFVAVARGYGFPAGAAVVLDWREGIGEWRGQAGADGTFTTSVLVFHRDRLGLRRLVAVVGGVDVAADDYLVVPASIVPRRFTYRR